jgi:uncharacterized protein
MVGTSIVLWAALLVAVALIYYVRHVEPTRLQIEQVELHIERLPRQLCGLRIGQISDTHLRDDRHSVAIAERAMAEIMVQHPNLICITGDIGHRSWHLDRVAGLLEALAAQYGVYAVLGNHDMDETLEFEVFEEKGETRSVSDWITAMEAVGIEVLFNAHRCLRINGSLVVIAGVGDPSCGYEDLAAALADAPNGDFHILLSHSPDIFDDPLAEWADLILCGHTHGGQLQLPYIGTPWAPVWRRRDRASGLMRVNQSTVAYVSRGVSSGVRARLNCPPEVTVFTLAGGRDDNLRIVT